MNTPRTTLEAVLRKSPERDVLLTRKFVGPDDHGGPVAIFLTERRGRALDLYLLFRAVAGPKGDPVALPSVVWARALRLDDLSSPEVAISRAWSWLEEEKLVTTERHGRLRSIAPMSDDGTGAPFVDPRDGEPDSWFSLPFAYFLGNYHNRIGLAGKCVLLAALAHGGVFSFVSGPPPAWHGMSQDSVKRGIRLLLTLGLVIGETRRVPDLLTASGYRVERRYQLTPALGGQPRAGR